MRVRWSPEAVGDLRRLYDFIAKTNPAAAVRALRLIETAPDKLKAHPRIGRRLDIDPLDREVRCLFEGRYEIRYEVDQDTIYVLRVWHGREDR